MATTRAQEQHHRADEEEEDNVEFGYPSPSDEFEETEELDAADTRPNLAARYAGALDREDPDEDDTVVDRAGPTLTEVQSLGPIEEMEVELFDTVEREVPSGSRTMKQVHVCKFCAEEFSYMTRDLHTHKDVCPQYPGRQDLAREVHSVPDDDNPEMSVDVEVVGVVAGDAEVDEEVEGPGAPAIDEEAEEEEGEEEEGRDEDLSADMGHEPGDEQEEDVDETQMPDLESLQVVVPDRVEVPADATEPRPTLKIAKPKAAVDVSGDVGMEEDSEPEAPAKMDQPSAAVGRSSPGNASETASTGSANNGRDAYRSSFRMFSDADGEHSECIHCGKVCSHRGSAMATHYKKCLAAQSATRERPVTRDEKSAPAQQSITPKKKATKRRISAQDFDALDDDATSQANESDADSYPGSPPLRRSKRFRSDSKGDHAASKAATEMEPLDLAESAGDAAAATGKRARSTDVSELEAPALAEFDISSPGTRIKCKHCGAEVMLRESVAEKHLDECQPYRTHVSAGTRVGKDTGRPPTTPAAPPRSQKRAKTTDRDSAGTMVVSSMISRHPERLQPADITKLDHDTAVSWIFGSQATVERMREHYGKKAMAARSPATRFHPVEAALCDLNVAMLLAQLPASAKITAVLPSRTRDDLEDAIVPCTSPSVALPLYGAGAVIAFPAPTVAASMFVPHLAKELKCGALVGTEMHEAELLCARSGLQLDWQYHAADCFVVCLRGKALWRLEPSSVKNPWSCFHLTNLAGREDTVKIQVASLGVGSGQTAVSVPTGSTFDFSHESDPDDDMDGDRTNTARTDPPLGGQQVVMDAGSVLYIPAGTWYKVDGAPDHEGDPMWLQIQLKTLRVGDVVADVVRQLVLSQEAMRDRLHEAPTGDASTPQQQLLTRTRELASQLMELSPNELLPELLFTTDATPSASYTVGATRVVEYDLTDPNGFQGGHHISVYKGSMFRVNPLAVLMRADELPSPAIASVGTTTAVAGPALPAAPKKALNRKSKRPAGHASSPAPSGPGPRAPSANGVGGPTSSQDVYVLYFGYSGVADQSRLKVQFRCNPAQLTMVNWIRARDTPEAFHVSELAKVLSHHQGGSVDTELLKAMLRFLCTAGYLAAVNVPL